MGLEPAYVAGLFDGEGTVGIYCAGENGEYFSVKLQIAGTYKPMLAAVHEHFGGIGSVYAQKRQALSRTPRGAFDTRRGRQCWKWVVSNRPEVGFVLRAIRPWLIEKASQADITLAFLDGKMPGRAAAKRCSKAKHFSFPVRTGETPARGGTTVSERNPAARLTYATAEEIRRAAATGTTQAALARKYGVSRTMLNRLVFRRTYTTPPRFVYGLVTGA